MIVKSMYSRRSDVEVVIVAANGHDAVTLWLRPLFPGAASFRNVRTMPSSRRRSSCSAYKGIYVS